MRFTSLTYALIVCLLAAPMALGTSANGSFGTPAQWNGQAVVPKANWAVIVFSPDDTAAGQFHLEAGATMTQYRALKPQLRTSPIGSFTTTIPLTSDEQLLSGSQDWDIRFDSGNWRSLLIRAETVSLHVSGIGVVVPQDAGAPISAAIQDDQVPSGTIRSAVARSPTTEVAIATEVSEIHPRWTLEFTGLREIEVHNATLDCSGSCPRYEASSSTPEAPAQVVLMNYLNLKPGNGTGSISGQATSVAIGAPSLDVVLSGAMRLPQFYLPRICSSSDCLEAHGETLQTEGIVGLERLIIDTGNPSRIAGSFMLVAGTARIDETSINAALLSNLATVAASSTVGLGIFAILKWLIAPFFTRLSKEKALEHPRRKAIFDYIQRHPGANFREVARNTGIAAGTVRHHLNVLERSDIIVEHQHGSTVRLFENQSRFQANWSDLVLLREPALGQLHAWLKEHPASPQKAILEGMEPQGWSRSTTQHRLARLVEGGVATIRLQGRLKIYSVVERPAQRPAAPTSSPASPNTARSSSAALS